METTDQGKAEISGNLQQKIAQLERKIFDLGNLLQAGKTFDNLLQAGQLHSVFTGIVQERIGMQNYALFIMNDDDTRFEMVRSAGLLEEIRADFSFPREEGLLWQAILKGRPFPTKDKSGQPRFPVPYEKHSLTSLESIYFIPLVHQKRVVGLLSIGEKKDKESYKDDDLEFLTILAEQAAVSITTAQLYEKKESDKAELDKTVKNLSILYNIGRAMIQIRDLKNLVKFILGQAIETTEAQKGSLMLYDQQTSKLVVRVVKGLPDKDIEEAINSGEMPCTTFAAGEGIAGKVFETKQPIITNVTDDDDRYKSSEGSNVESILCIPLVASEETVGVINITNKAGGKSFTSEDLELLTALGNQAAVAINNATLYEMAITDELTSLYVRRYFNVKLETEIRRAKRYHHQLSLAICDLDHFKNVNDTYGHQMGDRVLQKVAGLLEKTVRELDTAARYGGEEFGIVLPETDIGGASIVCERIRKAVGELKVEGLSQQITISIGLAAFPQHATEVQGLIEVADTALYSAKHQGRNRVCEYTPPAGKENGT